MSRRLWGVVGLVLGLVVLVSWKFSERAPKMAPQSVAFVEPDIAKATSLPAHVSVPAVDKRSQSAPVVDANRPFEERRLDLEQRARMGDGHAAWQLGFALANCNGYVPISDAELEDGIVESFATGLMKTESTPDAWLQKLRLGQAQRQRDCQNVSGLNESHLDNNANIKAFQWMELGASLGDADAQAMYSALAFQSFDSRNALAGAEQIRERKRLAIEYLQRSLAQGDGLALQRLSKAHSDGLLFPADAEVAYSYLFAFSLTPRASDFVPGLLAFALDTGAQALDAATLARSQEEGRLLARCCMAAAGKRP